MKNILVFIFLFFLTTGISAKKVICVDGCGTPFVNHHEGYERANMQVGDRIQVGGSLTDCMAQLEDGDELIIIAHGTGTGTGFIWGGMTYTGFGIGPGLMPVPGNFANLDDVKVHFCSCWSAKDPDGNGSNTSLTDKIIAAMGGTGNTAVGFNNLATSGAASCYTYTNEADTAAVNAALRMGTWEGQPPANRPNIPQGTKSQLDSAQCIVDAIPNLQGVIKITKIKYSEPYNSMEPPIPSSGCETCPEGCGFSTNAPDGQELDPTLGLTDFIPSNLEFANLGGTLYDVTPIIEIFDNNTNVKPLYVDLYVNGALVGQDNMHNESGNSCMNANPCANSCQIDIIEGATVYMYPGTCQGIVGDCYCNVTLPLWAINDISLNHGDEILLVVDPQNLVPEFDETNNELIFIFELPPTVIPTLSEWGLILLALLLITFSTVAILRRQTVQVGLESNYALAKRYPQALFFEPQLYWKTLPKVLLFVPMILLLFYFVYGFITIADVFGTLISAGIIAYLVHFILLSSSISEK